MTKADIVAQIAQQTGVNRTAVQTIVEAFMENIKDSMAAGNDVFLRGFGSFVVKQRARKVARNISKNTSIEIPAHSVPAFRPAKEFMNMVKEGR
ncbi:MAG: HU family DNA-binding protein [Bacteroides sp.]|uniref:HU family DNA-binding protein n=1 Tax=Bacteroides sp. TaxID=29523 RepID=UPI0026E107D9|nr:HU family DNA-binding protein [Bacteroides sp.]MDO5419796.1 HU family DNA-binding protein [Bacteroides sp.]